MCAEAIMCCISICTDCYLPICANTRRLCCGSPSQTLNLEELEVLKHLLDGEVDAELMYFEALSSSGLESRCWACVLPGLTTAVQCRGLEPGTLGSSLKS
ncbi:hypothetical protein AVEN_20886-1 [Araneus ventricosus]|uniref:Uncharacterized protein n=1 Tax=Araneus ventricosus TaxID=182803 RepID=A0A4Y2Q2S8_ARAVE|nr:hypothetical protein AVEN_20886-1 [Araneus ventricosus]